MNKPLSEKLSYRIDNEVKKDIKQALKAFKEDVCKEMYDRSIVLPSGLDRILQHEIIDKLKKHFGSLADEKPKTEVEE